MRLGIQNRWGAAPCEKPDGLPSGFFTRFSHRFAPVRAGLQRGKTTRTRALGAWVQGTGPGPGAGRMGARERAGTGRTGAREQAGTGRWAHGCKGAGRGRALGAWVQGSGPGPGAGRMGARTRARECGSRSTRTTGAQKCDVRRCGNTEMQKYGNMKVWTRGWGCGTHSCGHVERRSTRMRYAKICPRKSRPTFIGKWDAIIQNVY